MKKLIIGAAIVAAGAAGFWYAQQQTQSSVLDYVPADTALFSAQIKPFPIKAYIDTTASMYTQYPDDYFDDINQGDDPREKFTVSLLKSYFAAMEDGATFIKTFGVPEKTRSYFYMLGILPVLKIDIVQPDAIWALLDKAEAESGLQHELRTLQGVDYRAYTLTDNGDPEMVELIVAVDQGMLTIAFNTSFSKQELLETALGLRPVEQSIAAANTVGEITQKHGFSDEGVSFISHQQIIKALTTLDGNLMAKHLQKLFSAMGEDPFAELKVATCQQELSGISANWPRTVIGIDTLNVTPKQTDMSFRTVVESNNTVVMAALQKMRGFIPAYANKMEDMVVSLGIGLNANELTPALTQVWDDLLTPQYQCAPLAEIQRELSQQSPAMLGMATGMANGVQGLSVSILDYELDLSNNNPRLNQLDAVISLSAENPTMLINMVKPFVSQLANIKLPADGSAVDISGWLPLPPQVNVKPMMALKGQHLVIFSGDKGQKAADSLTAESLKANGMIAFAMDYQQAFSPLLKIAEMTGEPMPPELEQLKSYNMRLKTDLDAVVQGIVLTTKMNIKNKKLN